MKLALLILAAGFVAAWVVMLSPTFLGGPTGYVTVSGTSMQPTYHTGDLVLTRQQARYAPGDIVAYHVPKGEAGEGDIVIHRVVGGNATDGYETRGDNKKANDLWRPKAADVVGKAWLHVPGAGRWLESLKRPLPLSLLMGLLTTGSLVGKKKLRRRRNGRWKDMDKKPGNGGHLPAPGWLVGLLAALCIAATFSAFGAWTAFRSPVEQTQTIERLKYDQTASFDYTARMQPSSLYPDGVIGPVTADSNSEALRTLYTLASPIVDLGFHYAMKPRTAPPLTGFGGDVRAVIKVSSGEEGWTKTLDLVPPTPFNGTSTDVRMLVDLSRIQALIQAVETETKFLSGAYYVTVIPTVHVTGQLGATAVDDTYAPPFSIKLSRSQVVLDQSLSRSETRKQEDMVTARQHMSVWGLDVTVSRARWVTGGAMAFSVLAAAVVGAVVFLGVGRGEAARIRARYGSMVISVAEARLPSDESQQIRLASIQDLVRLANRDSRMVFHQVRQDGADVYFIQDGSLTYLYVSAGRPPSSPATVQEA